MESLRELRRRHRKIRMVTVRADSVTRGRPANAERARLEERFGAPRETRVHWSKQYADKILEVEGAAPSWRFTQSLTRVGDAKSPVAWPNMSLDVGHAARCGEGRDEARGFRPRKDRVTRAAEAAGGQARQGSEAAPPRRTHPAAKLIELGFKKGGEHVKLSIIDKTGLYRFAIGQDLPDRKTGRGSREASSGLGECLSEAETESTTYRDAMADVRLSITGFQGQRIVFETYRDPSSDLRLSTQSDARR